MLGARLTSAGERMIAPASAQSGRSSGVEHNLAKVGVEGSNPFARSNFTNDTSNLAGVSQAMLRAKRSWGNTGVT
jgi:hypothetical protein